MKRQKLKEIFEIFKTNTGLTSLWHKKYIKINKNKQTPLESCAMNTDRQFTKETKMFLT